MGLQFIPNQWIKFLENGESSVNIRNYKYKGDPDEFCQIVNGERQFQVKVTPDNDTDLITNGAFDTDLTGWTDNSAAGGAWAWQDVDGEGVALAVTAPGEAKLTQTISVTSGDVYRFQLTLDCLTGGQEIYVTAEVGGSPDGEFTGTGGITEPATANGIYTFYYEAATTGNVDFSLVLVGGGFNTGCVANVSMLEATLPVVTLKDCDGNTIDTITDFAFYLNYVTVTIDFDSYSEGCYVVCVYPEEDPAENLLVPYTCLEDGEGNCFEDEYGNTIIYVG